MLYSLKLAIPHAFYLGFDDEMRKNLMVWPVWVWIYWGLNEHGLKSKVWGTNFFRSAVGSVARLWTRLTQFSSGMGRCLDPAAATTFPSGGMVRAKCCQNPCLLAGSDGSWAGSSLWSVGCRPLCYVSNLLYFSLHYNAPVVMYPPHPWQHKSGIAYLKSVNLHQWETLLSESGQRQN